MDIKDLKYFITVVEAGSFSSASRILHVTQPALSWSIKQMEDEFGMQLLDRYNYGVKLTERGQVLYGGGKAIVENFERLERILRSGVNAYKREIRFGLTALSSIEYMHIFENFKRNYQQYNLVLIQRGSKEIQNLVLRGELEMGLVSEPVYFAKLHDSAKPIKGYFYDVGVVVSKNNPLYHHETVSIDDLKGMSFSLLSKEYVIHNEFPKRCETFGFQPEIVFENDNWEVLVEHVASYDTVTILPLSLQVIGKRDDVKWLHLTDEQISRFDLQLVTSLDLSIREEHLLFWRLYNEFKDYLDIAPLL